MANFVHGVSANEVPTSFPAPKKITGAVPFVVGTAPVHRIGGLINEPILVESFDDALKSFGYSKDWDKFTLCEMIYTKYALYGGGPMVLVNVLDPSTHKKTVAEHEVQIQNGKAELDVSAILTTLKVAATSGGDVLIKDTDYDAFYDEGKLVVEVTKTGAAKDKTSLFVTYDEVDTSAVTPADIIGGFDTETKTNSGFELLNSVYPKYGIVPDLLLAPGYSDNSEVAAIMSAKAEGINGLFSAIALIDADCSVVTHYADVSVWKNGNNLVAKNEVVLWPQAKLGEKQYHLSTQFAALIGDIDSTNGCPYESPSNKKLQIDSTVLANGNEVCIDIGAANVLNGNGICTALNFVGGFRAWGNYTAAYPANTDVKDIFVPVNRMFDWVAKSVIFSYWSKLDKPMTKRLIDSIVDSSNIWLNSLVADGKLLGAHIAYKPEENPLTDLMSGKLKFHIYMTPPTPAQEIDFVLEYDASYVETSLA